MTFGNRLKELRKRKGLTLKALADIIGSSKGYLSGIEHGKVNPPSDKFVRRIARAVGAQETDLLRLAYYDKVRKEVKTEFRTLGEAPEGGARGGAPGLVPLLNTAATGYPTEIGSDGLPKSLASEFVRIPGVSDRRTFALTVCEEDMTLPDGTGFRPGDIVLASAEGGVKNGDYVFAVFSTRERKVAHLRKVAVEGNDSYTLKPLNKDLPAHSLTRDDIDGMYRVVARISYLEEVRPGKQRT